MENRRQTQNTTTKSYNRDKNFSRPNGPSYDYRKNQSRDGQFAKRDNRHHVKGENRNPERSENRGGQNRDDRGYQSRDGRYQSRDNRFQKRDDRYQNRDERHHNRDDRYRSRDDRGYQSRDDRYQSRDDRYQSRDNRFRKPAGKFVRKDDRFQGKKRFEPKGKPKPWQKDHLPKIVSDMQITDGKHRGKYLQSTTSPKVRPTARRIREIMFKILYRRIRAKRFLDLCAGSGMVGMEAMSRGALLGTFVERSAKMCSFIRKNMEVCGIKEGHGEVLEMEAVPFLKQMKKRGRVWDVVYLDPPYDSDYEEILGYLSRGAAVEKGGVLVIEHHAEMFFPEKLGCLKRWRVVVQGDTALSFFERK